MTQQRDIDRLLDQWFSDGPTHAPDRVIDVVADRIERQPQRPAWRLDPRYVQVNVPAKTLAAAAAVLIVAVIGFNLVGGFSGPPFGDQQTTRPSVPVASPSSSSAVVETSPGATDQPTSNPTARPTVSPLKASGLVVFEYRKPGLEPRIQILASDQRGQELLPNVRGRQETPTWSADGRHLAFAASNPNDPTPRELIFETDPAGVQPKLLSTACEPPACMEETDPAYSADGTHLAFIRWSGPAGGPPTSSVVAIRDLTDGSVRELEPTRRLTAKADNRRPRWSPDGTRLVYHAVLWGADERAKDSIVFVIGTDGTGLRRLSPTDFPAGDAEWSPDGSLVLFGSQPLHAYWGNNGSGDLSELHVYTVAPDGSDLRQLDASGRAGSPSWAANGAQVLFTLITEDQAGRGVTNVNVMERDGSDPRFVAEFVDCCRWYPVQQPTP